MIKNILKNQKGVSLVEVTVASALSVMVAVGVMQINTNSQKTLRTAATKSELATFESLLKSRLSKRVNCNAATMDGTLAFVGRDITPDLGNPGDNDIVYSTANDVFSSNGTDADFAINQPISTARNWKVTSVRFTEFNRDNPGSLSTLIGECNIEINIEKVDDKTTYGGGKRVKIPMSCEVNASKVVQACSAIVIGTEEGHWKKDNDGVITFNGSSSEPKTRIGTNQIGSDTEAALTLDPVSAQVTPNGKLHGAFLADDVAITFGNSADIEVFYDPTVDGAAGSTLTIDSSLRFSSADEPNLYGLDFVNTKIVHANNVEALDSDTITIGDGDDEVSVGHNLWVNNVINADSLMAKTSNTLTIGDNNDTITIGDDLIVTDRIDASRIAVDGTIEHSSDRRFKKGIVAIKDSQEKLSQLRGTNYYFRREKFPERNFSRNMQYGLIAQEVRELYPNLVSENEYDGFLSVNYNGFIPILIQANNEQQAELDRNKEMFLVMQAGIQKKNREQDLKISELTDQNKLLQKRVDNLESALHKRIDELESKSDKINELENKIDSIMELIGSLKAKD